METYPQRGVWVCEPKPGEFGPNGGPIGPERVGQPGLFASPGMALPSAHTLTQCVSEVSTLAILAYASD